MVDGYAGGSPVPYASVTQSDAELLESLHHSSREVDNGGGRDVGERALEAKLYQVPSDMFVDVMASAHLFVFWRGGGGSGGGGGGGVVPSRSECLGRRSRKKEAVG